MIEDVQHQNALVEGRQILDCCLIPNEIIELKLKAGGVRFVFQVVNVYDGVCWIFLDFLIAKLASAEQLRK